MLQGMLATFSLVRRQDLLAYALQAARGQRDNLELEVCSALRLCCGCVCGNRCRRTLCCGLGEPGMACMGSPQYDHQQ